jgi:hypothetical protein
MHINGIHIKEPAINPDLEKRFTHHPPKDETQVARYTDIRDVAKSFSYALCDACPQSRELSLALTHLEEVVFWANASIARNE